MKAPQTIAILLLAVASLAGGGIAWRQYRELVQLRASAVDPNERADLQKRIWQLEKSNRELTDQLAALRAESEEDEAMAAAAALGSSERPTEAAPARERPRDRGGRGAQQLALRELMASPEVQAALNVQRKIGIEQRYAALFKNLNLTTDQADKLKALLAERQNTLQDIVTVAREQGINPRSDPDGFRKLLTDAQTGIEQGIKAVVGETGLRELQTYEQTMPQRSLVQDLQQRLSYTNTPLDRAQAEQLIQVLATNSPPRGGSDANTGPGFGGMGGFRVDANALASVYQGAVGGGSGGRGFNVPVTADAINQAQGFLSAPQVEALRQVRQQQQAQKQLQQVIRSTLQQNAPPLNTGGITVPGRRGGGGGGTGAAPKTGG